MLSVVLLLTVAALAIVRWVNRVPPQPAASASLDTKRQYWRSRIKANIADRDAYAKLGLLEESAGFFRSAQRNLESARLLGAEDKEISGPLGRVYMSLALVDSAEKELKTAQALAPSLWEPSANLIGFYVRNGRTKNADQVLVSFFQKADLTKLATDSLSRLGIALLENGKEQDSLSVAKELIRRDANSIEGNTLAARCNFASGNLIDARKELEVILKAAPDETTMLYLYGMVLRQQRDFDGALAAWQKANAANPTALDVYERIGEEYARRNDFAHAAVALARVAATDQSAESALKASEAFRRCGRMSDANYWKSVAAGLEGHFDQAIVFAKQSMASKDVAERRRGEISIAEAYRGMNKKPEYLQAILRATAKGSAEDLVLRGRAYEYLGNYDAYIESLSRVIQLDPKREMETRIQLATVYQKIGKRDEAEKNLQRVLELDPKNIDAMRSLIDLYFKTRSVGNHLDQAAELAQKVVSLSNEEYMDWFVLGQIYSAKDERKKAVYCFEHTIDLEAGYGPAYLELSRVYSHDGNDGQAKAAMELYSKYVTAEQRRQTARTKAQRSDATSADHVEYADILLQIGDTTEALQQFEQAYSKNPKDESLRAVLKGFYTRLNMPERLARLSGGAK